MLSIPLVVSGYSDCVSLRVLNGTYDEEASRLLIEDETNDVLITIVPEKGLSAVVEVVGTQERYVGDRILISPDEMQDISSVNVEILTNFSH